METPGDGDWGGGGDWDGGCGGRLGGADYTHQINMGHRLARLFGFGLGAVTTVDPGRCERVVSCSKRLDLRRDCVHDVVQH